MLWVSFGDRHRVSLPLFPPFTTRDPDDYNNGNTLSGMKLRYSCGLLPFHSLAYLLITLHPRLRTYPPVLVHFDTILGASLTYNHAYSITIITSLFFEVLDLHPIPCSLLTHRLYSTLGHPGIFFWGPPITENKRFWIFGFHGTTLYLFTYLPTYLPKCYIYTLREQFIKKKL